MNLVVDFVLPAIRDEVDDMKFLTRRMRFKEEQERRERFL